MGRIPEETIEQVASATDIVEVIGNYVQLKRAGSAYKGLCPFHDEKTPSFNVNQARQSFHCFGCQEGGSVFTFLMKYQNLDFPTVVRQLAEKANIPILEAAFDPEADQRIAGRKRLLRLHGDVAGWFHQNLLRSSAAADAREYLKKRSFGIDTARTWNIGYAPSGDALIQWARDKGHPMNLLQDAGLAAPRDENFPDRGYYARFRERIMFPIYNDFEEVIAFSGRILDPEAKTAKYMNSPETMLFNKSKTLYGFHKSRRPILKAKAAILCEGQLDAIRCFESGIENVVAPLGTAFTEDHARILKRHTSEVILCYDADGAGYKAAEKAFVQLSKSSIIVRVVALPPGEDPDTLIQGEGIPAFQERLSSAREFFDYQIDRGAEDLDLSSIRGRMQFADRIAATAVYIDDPVVLDGVVHKVSTRLGVAPENFRKRVTEGRSKRMREDSFRPRSRGLQDASREKPGEEPYRIQSNTVAVLCQMMLTDREARDYLRHHGELSLLRHVPETELLTRIWEADTLDVENSGSLATFLSTLPSGQQACISSLLARPIPPQGSAAARDCLIQLGTRALKNQIQEKTSLLKRADLSGDQVIALQKEVLDLKSRLTDIARSFPGEP